MFVGKFVARQCTCSETVMSFDICLCTFFDTGQCICDEPVASRDVSDVYTV